MFNKPVSIVVSISLILVLVVLSLSCSGTTAPPAPASSAAPAASAAAPAATAAAAAAKPVDVIKLKLADYGAPTDDMINGINWHEWWANQVKERTGGKLQIDVFHGETLCKQADSLNALDAGIADMVHFTPQAFADRFILTNFISDSSVCYGDGKLTSKVLNDLFTAGLMKEYDNYIPIYFSQMADGAASCLYTTKKKVSTLADMKGLKIRARGVPSTKLVEAMGGTPVTIATADLYMSCDRGLIDGLITPSSFYDTAKLYEVTKYNCQQGLTGSLKGTVMLPKKWATLTPEMQSVIKNLDNESRTWYATGMAKSVQEGIQHLTAKGGESYKLDPAEATKWKQIMDNVTNQQVADMQAKGQDMKKVMEIIAADQASFK
jgi:TRAP-type transport system periplasmic protein